MICQVRLHTMFWEFMSISCTHYCISFYTGIRNLTNNISVRYMNHHSVFRCVVLTFILDYQSFSSIVVSFALLLSSEFHFVSLEVGLVLANFNNPHLAEQNPDSAACRRAAGPARFRGRKRPTPIFLPRKSHGQKSLSGYSLRDHEESDTT